MGIMSGLGTVYVEQLKNTVVTVLTLCLGELVNLHLELVKQLCPENGPHIGRSLRNK